MGHASVLSQMLERNGSEEMRRLTQDCGAQMQERLEIGTVTINALAHATIPPRKTAVPCSDAFDALTENAGDNLIYQVMDDITDKIFIVGKACRPSSWPIIPVRQRFADHLPDRR